MLGLSVRIDRWRYTEWNNGGRVVAQELYVRPVDADEIHHLAGESRHAAEVAELRQLLDCIPRFKRKIPSTAPSRDYH